MATELSISSFNVHWGGLDWVTLKPYDLGEVLQSMNTDLIALQEMYVADDNEFYQQFAARAGYEFVYAPLSRAVQKGRRLVKTGGEGSWGIGLFTRIPVITQDIVVLPHVTKDPVQDRVAMRVDLDLSGIRMSSWVVHLSSRVPVGSLKQLYGLQSHLHGPMPTVVMGDFNLWGGAVSALSGMRRALTHTGTWPAWRPHSQIDHILCSKHWNVKAARRMEATGSDHRPIQARLSLKTR